MISILLIPLALCLILVLIHVFFGVHILRRGILFIDLALAQWAAFGYLVGYAYHVENPLMLLLCGFSATIVAAFILAIIKPLFAAINLQEAIIGVMYILAASAAMAFISSTGLEVHHLKSMFTGHLLFVQLNDLWLTMFLYTCVGFICFIFYNRLFRSQSQLSEFLFYTLFGLVVTSSVKLVGLLLVFSFLVIPVLSVFLFVKSIKMQTLLGWGIGVIASCLGLLLSIVFDIPPSLCVILVLCGMLVLGIGVFLSLKRLGKLTEV